jgi:hypothetical protein
MKVHKPGTDCKVEFSIFANGEPCPEYVLPDTDDEDSTASVCFIAIPDDAAITIHGTFSGSVLFGRVDVLADGSFVADRIIEDACSKEGVLKYWDHRKVDVKTFLHVPDLNDHKPRLRPKVVEGGLVTKRLSNKEMASTFGGGEQATGIGVGSITLVVSLNQEVFDVYGPEGEPAYPSNTLGDWRDRVADVADSGIRPEHELKMDVFPDSNPVKDKRATLFWRDTKAARYGPEPWAYLIFYYRTQAAIDAAGCVPLTASKALPKDGGLFIRAQDQEMVAAERAKKSPSPVPPPAPALGMKRSMGLGQALLLPGSQRARESPQFQRAGSNNDSERDSLFGSADEAMPKTGSDKKANDKTSNNNADLEHTPSMMRSSLFTKCDDAASPFKAASPSKVASPSQAASPRVTFSEPLVTGSTKDPEGTGNSFADDDSGFQFDDVAAPLLPAFESHTPATMPAMGTINSTTVHPPTKTLDLIKRDAIERQRHLPPHKRPASHLDSNTPTRSSLSATASPSPYPAKRLRNEEIQQRKARLEAELKAKRERKAAIQKKALDEENNRREQQRLWAEEDAKRRAEEEEQRRAAEEEEEARKADELLIAEMEALERENEMEDEEFERAVEESEKQRMEWEELVRAREMEDGV